MNVIRENLDPSLTLAVLTGVGLFAVLGLSCHRSSGTIHDLVRAADAMPHRRVAARLSGGFAYRPLATTTRAATEPAREKWALLRVAAKLSAAAHRDPSPEALHRAGGSALLAGSAKESVAALEESLHRETKARVLATAILKSKNASVVSDLAAAYLARAPADDSLDLLAAMNAAERAWQLARTPEAAWNRALAISAAGSRDAALAAWRDFLAVETELPWVVEARQRIDAVTVRSRASRKTVAVALTAALGHAGEISLIRAVALGPGYARGLVEDELLPKWGAGDESALVDARRVAAAVARISGDFLAADSVTRIEAMRKVDARATEEVRAALVAFGNGRRALATYRYEEALPLISRSEVQMRAAGLPLAKRASVFVATLHFYAHRADTAMALCSNTIRANDPARYPSVTAQCKWNEGTIETGRRHFDRAKAAFEDARALFVRMSDFNNIAALDVRLEENERWAGDITNAWSRISSALRNGAAEGGYIPLSEAAKVADAAAMPFAALAFYDSAVHAARAARSAAEQTDGSLSRARLLWKLGRGEDARAELTRATRFMVAIGDRTVAARLHSYLVLARAELTVAQQPERVVKELEEIVTELAATGNRRKIAEARCLQAKGNLLLGRIDAAQRSLRAALAELDLQRLSISSDEERLALVNTGREAAEILVGLLYDSGRHQDAFRAAEAAKAQLLVDAIGRKAPTLTVPAMAIPAISEAFVDYFVLPNRVLVWSVTRSVTRAHAINVDRLDLEKLIYEWQRALGSADDHAIRSRGAALFDHLVRPVWNDIAPSRTIVFAPDSVLHRVPFAALPDPASKAFLVENHDISHVPSLTWLGMGAQGRSGLPRRVVAVLASRSDAYEPLPAAEQDIRAVAEWFPGTIVLTGADADPQRVAAATREAELFHFAGHAIVDEERPGRSALIMNKGRPWRASTIAAERLTRAPLVVLAACSTGAGRVTSDGTASIARSFLLAGSHAAVATLWPVKDSVASEISDSFYRSLASGSSARAALCAAQRTAIHHLPSNARYDWAAFQFIGS